MKIAIIADHTQATTLIASNIIVDQVFSLCPTASYTLKKSGINVISSTDYYKSLSHAKTAITTTRQADLITKCGTDSYKLNASEISGFRANIIYTLSTLYYFYYATRHYRHTQATFVSCSKTSIQQHPHYDAAFAALVEYALRRYNHAYENRNYSALHHVIAKMCNRILWVATRAKHAIRVVHFGESALTQVEDALAIQQQNLLVFKPRTLGKTIVQTLHVTLATLAIIMRKRDYRISYFRHTKPSDYHADFSEQTKKFAAKCSALKLHFPLPIFAEHVVADAEWYMPFLAAQFKVGANIARDLAPHLTMTNKGKYHFIRSAVAHMPKHRSIGLLINHGTHTAQPLGSISQIAANLWASDDRICFYGIDTMVPRLPLTATQVEQICPTSLPTFLPLPTVQKITRVPGDPQKNFKIIFAGNYIGTLTHIPWCTETAEEYLLNILALIEAIGTMQRVEFIIKLKARKASAHISILHERIDALGLTNVRIDTDTKFAEMLKDTHLLISNLSTTIEEALTNRIPVLLHTHRKHYFHLPCAFDLPQEQHLGYVYAVRKGQNLQTMIEGIRAHYHQIIASDAALSGIVWQEGQYNDLQAFAAHVTQLAKL